MFASGGLGVLHWNQTGVFSSDYRSLNAPAVGFSLQITFGRSGGWVDIDAYNPYQSPVNFYRHAAFEVFTKRDQPFGGLPSAPSPRSDVILNRGRGGR